MLRQPLSGAPSSLIRGLPSLGTLGPLIALLAACAFFATQTDRFLTGDNLSLVLQQVMVVGVIAMFLGSVEGALLSGFFTSLWLTSAGLFRKAALERSPMGQ